MSPHNPAPQSLFIGGDWLPAAEGRTFVKADPFTGEPVTEAAAAGVSDAAAAVAAAADAFPRWASTEPALRREVLERAAELISERAPEIAATMTAEVGATFGWGMFNCSLAAGMLQHAAALADAVDDAALPSGVPGLNAKAVRQPVGVVVGIAPWNAPIILATRAVAAPLALGNTVVLKASEECPRTHAAIVEAIADAGAPAGVINFLANAPADAADVVAALIADPNVARINFTGSTRVGRVIASKAAEHLKPTLLELGGKAPLVVLADGDLDEAAAAANFGAFMNSGQICMSTERLIVDRTVADEFATRLVARAEKLVVGDPRDAATQVGPVVSWAAAARIGELIEDAKAKGARVLTGGTLDGLVVTPTVIADVTRDMRLYGEESFGPVVTLVAVDGPDEAVNVANDTEYGLAAAVFGRDLPAARDVARRIRSGICHINGATVHDEPPMPFGGVKASGWGRFGGTAAIDEFTDLRWLTEQNGARAYPI